MIVWIKKDKNYKKKNKMKNTKKEKLKKNN